MMKKKVDIVMKLRILKNIFKQGFQGMWRNRGMGLASVGSITAVLIILGLVLIMVLSVNNAVIETKDQFDEIQVFLDDNITEDQEDSIKTSVEAMAGVKSVTYLSKDEALEEMKEDWKENAGVLEGIENNPLPDSYIIKLDNVDEVNNIVNRAEKLDGVDEVKSFQDLIGKLLVVTDNIQIGGFIIIVILVLISIFIISNTIKLTVTARRREIGIMKYVGATNGYIRGPFVIEGLLFGLIGSLLSILIINYGYQYFFGLLTNETFKMLSDYLISPKELFKDVSIIFVSIGMGIGVLGSLVSIKRFLNV